jgi:hypothetical protein
MNGEAGSLAGLFASSFLSATLLPGNAEIVLAAVLAHLPHAPVLGGDRRRDDRQHRRRHDVARAGPADARGRRTKARAAGGRARAALRRSDVAAGLGTRDR